MKYYTKNHPGMMMDKSRSGWVHSGTMCKGETGDSQPSLFMSNPRYFLQGPPQPILSKEKQSNPLQHHIVKSCDLREFSVNQECHIYYQNALKSHIVLIAIKQILEHYINSPDFIICEVPLPFNTQITVVGTFYPSNVQSLARFSPNSF